jgi:hypothetical protein
MVSHRPLGIVLALGLSAATLAACGSEDQSSGLLGISVDSAVVINEVCSTADYCTLAKFCAAAGTACSAATDSAACEDACAERQLETHGTDDWVELYNLTDREVDLEGYYLGDSSKRPLGARLPEGTVIAAHGYLLLFAKGLADGGRDLGFRLHDGESVVLSSPAGTWLDQLWIKPSPTGGKQVGSWARIPDGTGPLPDSSCFFPTPGWENSSQCATESP